MKQRLVGRRIILGVTGCIAAYKAAAFARLLVSEGADVTVILTKNATEFVTPLTFEALTGNKCWCDTFASTREGDGKIAHISLMQNRDICVIAPATANIIGKIANGIADEMLSTCVLACKAPILICPAMNDNMYSNVIVQSNLKRLQEFGYHVLEPMSGALACGSTGKGRLPDPELILTELITIITRRSSDLMGLQVLITAGPTIEKIDAVRFISNHSTGKMGYALANTAHKRGAKVTLVTGPTTLSKPEVDKVLHVSSAKEMFEAVKGVYEGMDLIIMTAAVADFTPINVSDEKLKKNGQESITLVLKRTDDILEWVGENRQPGQVLCGFSMETNNLIENSRRKLQAKRCNLIVANSISEPGSGFSCDTNKVILLDDLEERDYPLLSKEQVSDIILDRLLELRRQLNVDVQ